MTEPDRFSDMKSLADALSKIQLSTKSAILLDETESDYVLDLDIQSSSLSSDPLVAATSSNFSVRLFSKDTLASSGVLSGHSNVISGIKFSQEDKNLLYTSSQDNTLRCWDLRTPKKAALVYKGFEEVNSVFTCFDLSCDERVLCAGSEVTKDGDAFLTFWDRRENQQLGCYSESHQDDITQVKFHPFKADSLASGSTDGLVCIYDITQDSEDDALISTFNSCSSVQRIGWCGSNSQEIYCITHIDTFHLWQGFEGELVLELTDIKEKATDVDYLIDCVQKRGDSLSSQVMLLTGNHSGSLQLMEASKVDNETYLNCVCQLTDGHSATVRCMIWDQQTETLFTGAEDSLLCMWSAQTSPIKTTPTKSSKIKARVKSAKSRKGKPY